MVLLLALVALGVDVALSAALFIIGRDLDHLERDVDLIAEQLAAQLDRQRRITVGPAYPVHREH